MQRFNGIKPEETLAEEKGEEQGVDLLVACEKDDDSKRRTEISEGFLLIPLFWGTLVVLIDEDSKGRELSDW